MKVYQYLRNLERDIARSAMIIRCLDSAWSRDPYRQTAKNGIRQQVRQQFKTKSQTMTREVRGTYPSQVIELDDLLKECRVTGEDVIIGGVHPIFEPSKLKREL